MGNQSRLILSPVVGSDFFRALVTLSDDFFLGSEECSLEADNILPLVK